MTYADLSFTHWNDRIDALIMCAPEKKFEGFPNVKAWHERMVGREAWRTIMDKRAELMDEQGYQANGLPKGINSPEEYQEMIKAKMAGK
jgi:glutathione S-transferase